MSYDIGFFTLHPDFDPPEIISEDEYIELHRDEFYDDRNDQPARMAKMRSCFIKSWYRVFQDASKPSKHHTWFWDDEDFSFPEGLREDIDDVCPMHYFDSDVFCISWSYVRTAPEDLWRVICIMRQFGYICTDSDYYDANSEQDHIRFLKNCGHCVDWLNDIIIETKIKHLSEQSQTMCIGAAVGQLLPDVVISDLEISQGLIEEQRYEEADQLFEKLVERAGEMGLRLMQKALIIDLWSAVLHAMGDKERELSIYLSIIEDHEYSFRCASFCVRAGLICHELGRIEEAKKYFGMAYAEDGISLFNSMFSSVPDEILSMAREWASQSD
ncbi:hypothetical protein JXA32_09980 [Candidatus Sumerlaeota bacterium]|nr:hypothetical protein [Candidatus Sumerlaeota bacterium]